MDGAAREKIPIVRRLVLFFPLLITCAAPTSSTTPRPTQTPPPAPPIAQPPIVVPSSSNDAPEAQKSPFELVEEFATVPGEFWPLGSAAVISEYEHWGFVTGREVVIAGLPELPSSAIFGDRPDRITRVFGDWPDNLWAITAGPGAVADRGSSLVKLRGKTWSTVRKYQSHVYRAATIWQKGAVAYSSSTQDCDATLAMMVGDCTRTSDPSPGFKSHGVGRQVHPGPCMHIEQMSTTSDGAVFALGTDCAENIAVQIWNPPEPAGLFAKVAPNPSTHSMYFPVVLAAASGDDADLLLVLDEALYHFDGARWLETRHPGEKLSRVARSAGAPLFAIGKSLWFRDERGEWNSIVLPHPPKAMGEGEALKPIDVWVSREGVVWLVGENPYRGGALYRRGGTLYRAELSEIVKAGSR